MLILAETIFSTEAWSPFTSIGTGVPLLRIGQYLVHVFIMLVTPLLLLGFSLITPRWI